MANYIDANIFYQAYVHIDIEQIREEMLDALQKELELFLATRGRFILCNEAKTDVELKTGSLKVYAKIAHYLPCYRSICRFLKRCRVSYTGHK